MDALLEGIDLEKRDKAYAVSVISDYLKISDQALVASTYDFYAKKCCRPCPTSGPSNPNLKNFDVRTMIDNSFLENAAKKRR